MGIFTGFLWIALDCFASLRGSAFASAPHARNDGVQMSLRGAQSATKQSSKNNAFTLAEIMIVLTVIGILTAILLPAARQITPDENVIKFKKAHNALHTVIRELVTSDKYYLDGDLAYRANGARIDGTHSGDYTYLCQSFAEMVNTKSVNCSNLNNICGAFFLALDDPANPSGSSGGDVTQEVINNIKGTLDYYCGLYSEVVSKIGKEIVTSDDVIFYQPDPYATFTYSGKRRYDSNGFDIGYKVFCMDIDEQNSGEAPFGYGIRVDGKILNGARADAWLNKSIQGDD